MKMYFQGKPYQNLSEPQLTFLQINDNLCGILEIMNLRGISKYKKYTLKFNKLHRKEFGWQEHCNNFQ